jgi:hypothetical protein
MLVNALFPGVRETMIVGMRLSFLQLHIYLGEESGSAWNEIKAVANTVVYL